MTNSVTFPVGLGGNGNTYTDDTNSETGLDNYGWRTRFVPCLSQTVVMAQTAVTQATAAAASAVTAGTQATNAATSATTASTQATNAANSAIAAAAAAATAGGVTSTSTTSLGLTAGTKSLSTQTGKSYPTGMGVRLYNDSTHYMDGSVSAYNSGTGALDVAVAADYITGSGTFAVWTIFPVTLVAPAAAPVDAFARAIILSSNYQVFGQ